MSIHINAPAGAIAETVILPGDPLRAQYIADNMLTEVHCYNKVRGMLGFTGYYQGKRISVQGTGMGIPSLMIYTTELIREYGAKKLIRVGTCGGLQESVKVRDVIIAASASTNSAVIRNAFPGMTFAPTANIDLLLRAVEHAKTMQLPVKVGSIITSDVFYQDKTEIDQNAIWRKYGILGVEMETAGLYFLAARYNVAALTLLTVSDHIITGEITSAEEREKTFNEMINLALHL